MILRSRGCWIQIVHYHTEINFDVQLHFFSLSLTWGAENVSGKPRVNSKLPGGIELGVGRKQRSSSYFSTSFIDVRSSLWFFFQHCWNAANCSYS